MAQEEKHCYAAMKQRIAPVGNNVHGQHCEYHTCFEKWACETGFETMNPEGRERIAQRQSELISPATGGE